MSQGAPFISDVAAVVCSEYGVSRVSLVSERRTKELLEPRHVAMYVAATITRRSLTQIGFYFNRDHTSVIHGRNKIAALYGIDADLSERIDRIARFARARVTARRVQSPYLEGDHAD